MTYDDDFVRIHMLTGPKNIRLSNLGLEWPPPERIEVCGFGFRRITMSEITDEERADMTHVCRGAEYQSETHHPGNQA